MTADQQNVCQICKKEQQHVKRCLDCGLVFCPCSKVYDIDIIVDVSAKCPNCGSTRLHEAKE